MTMKKKRLSNFDFSGENAAVALVSELENGAANGYKTLTMKSTDVVVELSMAEYLNKFFGVWSYEAQILSKLLGYSDDYELWDEASLEEKTTILKGMKDSKEYKLEDLQQVAPLVKSLAEASNFKITDLDEILKDTNGEEPVSDNKVEDVEKSSETSPKEEVIMTTETIEKSAYEAEVQKAKDLQTKLEAEAELKKGLEDALEVYKAKELAAQKAEFITKAKTLDVAGIEGDAVEPMAVAMQKASMQEDTKVLVETIEKMATLLKAAGELKEPEGHSLNAGGEEKLSVADILKANQESKKSKIK